MGPAEALPLRWMFATNGYCVGAGRMKKVPVPQNPLKAQGLAMRVLIVDDHEVVRRGVRSLLEPHCEVCGEAVDGRDALEKARQLKPDVIVMDVSMADLNGLEATSLLRSILPNCEVLILSQHESPEMVRQAIKAGARGYVVKSAIARDLLTALDKLSRHEPFFDPAIVGPVDGSGNIDAQEILQRTQALEKALLESEELYRSTFELAAIGLAHMTPEGRWLRVNKKLCEILGYGEEELMNLTFQEITHPDDLAVDFAEAEKIKAGISGRYSVEKRYVRKDKSVLWVNLLVSPVRDANRQLKHLIAIVEDISNRRKAEEAQVRLAAVVESSDDAIISKDLNGIITTWNASAQRIFEFSAEEAVGRSITMIIPPELQDEEKQILKRLRNGERIEHYETIRVTKSGRKLNMSLTVSPLKDSKGRIIGASKVARNITERKRAEEELRESRNQLADALAASRTAMFDWDIQRRRGRWNPELAALYGCNPRGEEITAEEWHTLLHPDDRLRVEAEAEQAIREGAGFQFEFRTIRGDGSMRWILSRGRIVRETGRIRMIGTHTDITERKEAEEVARMRELSGKLLHAQDEERRRIARELHDSAGQIIAALQMNLIPMEVESRKINSEFAASIEQSLELLDQLSKELRTVSYLLHPPLLDEAGLSSALRWYVEGFAERSGIEVDFELAPDLGRLGRDMEITVFRIIQESLTNIHRHANSKQAAIRVQRSLDQVSVEVQDHGKGIGESNNGKPGKVVREGVGIQGMRERVRQLGGRFEIHSGAKGTCVAAIFPIEATGDPHILEQATPA